METVIILGAGQFGRGAARLLNQENMALLAFGDNNPALHQQRKDFQPMSRFCR